MNRPINFKPILEKYNKDSIKELLQFLYDQHQHMAKAAKMIGISHKAFWQYAHRHGVVIRVGARPKKDKVKRVKTREQKQAIYESRRSHKKKVDGGRACTWPGCKKSTGSNRFFCPVHFKMAGHFTGIEGDAAGGIVLATGGRHRGA